MGLVIRNAQVAVRIRRALLRQNVARLRALAGAQSARLAVLCSSSERMRALNRTYCGHDEVTDVLAFPNLQIEELGKLPELEYPEDCNLGDIFLGVEYIQDLGRNDNASQECSAEHLHNLLTITTLHGICHLLGYTHESEADWRQMFQKEKDILEDYGRLTGVFLSPLTAMKY
uniref:YbeY metalloendoribonuclease n=1 Tax=Eptatretus burgeri TaxID=7764 RepID=A0A8C4X2H2_EPTBU